MQRRPEKLQTPYPPDGGAKPRKLIFYTHALVAGGAERVWSQLASGFAERGDEVILALDSKAPGDLQPLHPKVRAIVLGGGHARTTWRLGRLIAREAPDAVLAALCVSNLKASAAALLAGRLDRLILSYHGFAESEPQRLSRLSYRLTPALTRLAAATVAVSDGLRGDLIGRWRGAPARIHRIYNPVRCPPVPTLAPADLVYRPPAVVAAGRLDANKNMAALIEAFAQVEPRAAVLTILGDGPERATLDALVDRLGLRGRVRFAGHVRDPWPWFAQARCLALASRTEAFGLVLVEALAAGLAVVSTDCSGPREILEDGRHGALTPPGDRRALAEAITRVLADPGDPAPRQARAARFSPETALDAYSALIDAAAARGRSRRAHDARRPAGHSARHPPL